MSGHTPGPWAVAWPNPRIVSAQEKKAVASPHFAGYEEDEIEANARLIAAAPELLEALRALVAVNEEHNARVAVVIGAPKDWNDSYLAAARAAIAKAEGGAA
jgi:hypothetical protein